MCLQKQVEKQNGYDEISGIPLIPVYWHWYAVNTMGTHYHRTGFDCEYLLNAKCEFF